MIEEFDAARLATARERLEAMVERMRAGEFEVTEDAVPGALLRLSRGGAPLPAAEVEARS